MDEPDERDAGNQRDDEEEGRRERGEEIDEARGKLGDEGGGHLCRGLGGAELLGVVGKGDEGFVERSSRGRERADKGEIVRPVHGGRGR